MNTSELVFWRSIRKISEFGLRDVELPIGVKAPVSEKLKNVFRLGGNMNTVKMQPEFIKIDELSLLSIKLDERILVIQAVPDLAKTDIDFIEITYPLLELQAWGRKDSSDNLLQASRYPKINYRSKK